jgi:hypothetical protein
VNDSIDSESCEDEVRIEEESNRFFNLGSRQFNHIRLESLQEIHFGIWERRRAGDVISLMTSQNS